VENVEICTTETSGSANQTVELEMDKKYRGRIPLSHTNRLSVVTPYQGQQRKGRSRTSWRRTTVRRTNSGKDLETGQGNSWKQSANTPCSKVE